MTKRRTFLGLSALLLLCSAACQAQSDQSTEKINREFALPTDAGRGTLALYNIFGSVTVTGYAGTKILVEATKTITANTAKTLEIGKAELKLGFAQHGDSVVVYLAAPYDSRPNRANGQEFQGRKQVDYKYTINYVVRVPYQLNLHVSTVNHGAVLVQDVAGSLAVFNVNGAIALRNVRGTTEARTVNGNVDASYVASPPGASSYNTINGQIKVKYPTSLAADLHFKSMHGELYTDFSNVETLPVQVTKNHENQGEGTVYTLTKDRAVRIGRGGPGLHFETLNGGVTVVRQ